MAGNVEFLLQKIDSAVKTVRDHYEADLAAKQVSDDLLYAVAHMVTDCLMVLDWTANAIKEQYGPQGGRSPYFPLRASQPEFERGLEEQIKGLRANHPDIADAMERHQPYQPGKTELGYLHKIGRVNKHQDFTAQERNETKSVATTGREGGQVKYTEGVTFLPGGGIALGEGGSISFGPGGSIELGPGETSIMGVPVDPQTQRPVPHPAQMVTETIYVDWRFIDPPVSVLPTLEALARLVRDAVEDVRREAQL